MTTRRRTARPPDPLLVPADDAISMAKYVLLKNHKLNVPLGYLVIVEGTTDVAYLQCSAARLNDECGVDLLRLNDPEGNFQSITICTPLNPLAQGNRGGTPQIIRLADDLKQHVMLFQTVCPVCFVLDHDTEGRGAAKMIRDTHKYTSDIARPITLDPKCHRKACQYYGKGERPIVVEDLLSLKIQTLFFESGAHCCDVSYEEGKIARFEWREPSKSALCEFVCSEARADDVLELARVLMRVRELWRLEVPTSVRNFIDS
jgi:hypothetical protein